MIVGGHCGIVNWIEEYELNALLCTGQRNCPVDILCGQLTGNGGSDKVYWQVADHRGTVVRKFLHGRFSVAEEAEVLSS